MATVDSITNPDQMFADAGINLVIARATHADAKEKKITLSDGRELPYDKLLLGTGASPVVPPIEGCDLEGVFSLRSAPDAVEINNFPPRFWRWLNPAMKYCCDWKPVVAWCMVTA